MNPSEHRAYGKAYFYMRRSHRDHVICDYCANPAELVSGAKIYRRRPDLKHLAFWHCSPCDAYVGCHKNSNAVPLGRLANKKLRAWKKWAHDAFDPLWMSQEMQRREAYAWLAREMGIAVKDCHIGMFDEAQCERVVQIVQRRNT